MHRFAKWHDALRAARDEKAVVALMQDYVSVIQPQVIDLLPADAQSTLIGNLDVQSAAVSLLHAELMFRGSPEIGQLLHEIAHTFAAASVRLSFFRTEPIIPPAE